jgi:hypothetical protein
MESRHEPGTEGWVEKWYSKDAPKIPKETRQLLESYSKIPAEEVDDHVTKIVRLSILASYMTIG